MFFFKTFFILIFVLAFRAHFNQSENAKKMIFFWKKDRNMLQNRIFYLEPQDLRIFQNFFELKSGFETGMISWKISFSEKMNLKNFSFIQVETNNLSWVLFIGCGKSGEFFSYRIFDTKTYVFAYVKVQNFSYPFKSRKRFNSTILKNLQKVLR